MSKRIFLITLVAYSLLLNPFLAAKTKKPSSESLADYVHRLESTTLPPQSTPGSLWVEQGRFSDLASDYKARRAGDLVNILVIQDVQAQNTGNVSTNRQLSARSGIDALAGHISTSGVQNILTLNSSQSLEGKAQASSSSKLRTALAGRVAAVLSNGYLVVEAEREVTMNNERQTVRLRGIVRPGDLGPDNTVSSNSISNLELELKGKGVVSDGTRPPNPLVRWLLWAVGF